VKRIKTASEDELAAVAGRAKAKLIINYFAEKASETSIG